MVGPMAGQVSGQPLSPGDVRGDRETRLTEHGDKGWSGYSLASSALSCMSYRYGLTRLPVPGRAALSFDYVQWLGNTYGPPARQAVHRGLPGIAKCKNARNQEKKSSTGCRANRYSAAGAPQAHRRDTAGTP